MRDPTLIRIGYDRGVNPSIDPSSVPPTSVWKGMNFRIDQSGLLRIRTGAEPIMDSLGDITEQGSISAFDNILMAWDRDLYLINPVTGVETKIGDDLIGETSSDRASIIRWATGGAEVVYLFPGNGIFQTDGATTTLVDPYTPETGEEPNLIRSTDGTQEIDSGPARCKYTLLRASLSQRVVAAGDPESPNSLYMTDPLDVSYWPADQIIQLPDDGGVITGLANWYNSVIIFRDTDVWAFFGSDVTDASASLVLQSRAVGCVEGRTIALVPGVGMVYKGSDNIYALTGISAVEDQVESYPLGDDIIRPLEIASSYGYENVHAIYHNREYRVVFPDCPENERVFCYSIRKVGESNQGWFMDSGPKTSSLFVHESELYGAKVDQGKILAFRDVLLDDREAMPYNLSFRRESLQPGPARIKKIYLYILLTGRIQTSEVFFFGSPFNANMLDEGDIEEVRVAKGTDQTLQVNVLADGNTYTIKNFTVAAKQMPFATLEITEPVRIYEARFRPSLKGNFAQIQIFGTVPEQDIAILGYGIEYSGRGRIHGVKEGVSQ